MRHFRFVMPACALLTVSAHALADDAAPAPADPEVARLADGRSQKWNYVPAGKHERYGHSEVLISAPAPYVRELVRDFAHYRDYSSGKFKTARVVDKTDATTDVYLQVPVLHGMVMLWEVLRFGELHKVGADSEMMTGTLVRGNVKSADVWFTLRAVGDKTVLKADIEVTPDFASPQSMVDEELRDAAQNAVDAVQARAQQHYAQWLAAHTAPATQPAAVASTTAAPVPAPQ